MKRLQWWRKLMLGGLLVAALSAAILGSNVSSAGCSDEYDPEPCPEGYQCCPDCGCCVSEDALT